MRNGSEKYDVLVLGVCCLNGVDFSVIWYVCGSIWDEKLLILGGWCCVDIFLSGTEWKCMSCMVLGMGS